MNRNTILISVTLFLLGISVGTAQVGVNTASPKATLDVPASTTDGTKPEGLLIPRLTSGQLRQMTEASGVIGEAQNSMLVFITQKTDSFYHTGKYEYIDAPGYYYYKHNSSDPSKSRWKKLLDTEKAPTGLEWITENNISGWRFIGANPENYGNIGEYAVDLSYSASASNEHGATGPRSFAVGQSAESKGMFSVAIGNETKALGNGSVAIGYGAKVLGGYYSLAIGKNVEVADGHSIAMGFDAKAKIKNSISIGYNTEAQGEYSYAFGHYTKAYSANSMAFGFYNTQENNPTTNSGASSTNHRLLVIGNGWTGVESDAFTILRNGKVGIHIDNFETNNSDAKLQVNGKALIGNFGSNQTTNTIKTAGNAKAQLDVRGDVAVATMDSSTSIEDKIVVRDNTTGVLKTIARSSFVDKNIYTADGTITGTRTVTLANDASNITFTKTTANSNPLLVVNGTVKMTAADMNSDARLKEKVADLTAENIDKLRAVSYVWNTEGKKRGGNDKLQYGFIAQEVEKVYPNLVSIDKDGYKSLNYVQVVPILTKALQEERQINKKQQEQLDKQAKEIEELKVLINKLMKK